MFVDEGDDASSSIFRERTNYGYRKRFAAYAQFLSYGRAKHIAHIPFRSKMRKLFRSFRGIPEGGNNLSLGSLSVVIIIVFCIMKPYKCDYLFIF